MGKHWIHGKQQKELSRDLEHKGSNSYITAAQRTFCKSVKYFTMGQTL